MTCGGSNSPTGAIAIADVEPSDGTFSQFTHFGGFDWAKSEHQLCVVDPRGCIVHSRRFADDAEGWAELRRKIAEFPKLAIAIETNYGPAVGRLLDVGLTLFAVNPGAAERYRYLQYLARRYEAFKAWEVGKKAMRYGFIHSAYKRDLRYAVKTTPMTLFGRGVDYLTDRIRNTKLGRILHQRGNALAQSFEEFRVHKPNPDDEVPPFGVPPT